MSSDEEEPGGSGSSGGSQSDEPLVTPLEESGGDAPAPTSPSSVPRGGGASFAAASPEPPARPESPNMLPGRGMERSPAERLLVRLIATAGVVGIGVAIAAIMVSNKSQGWIVGLVVSIVSVILAAILWSSRAL